MKTLLIFIAVAATTYGSYRWWSDHRQGTVVTVTEPTPVPVEKLSGPRLAPEGTYFLLDYYGVHTARGVTGWTPGQQVKAVRDKDRDGSKLWVTDGQLQSEIDEALLTRDIDLAANLTSSDIATQAAAARQASVARDQQILAEKRDEAEAARASARADARRLRTAPAGFSIPANPLDRAANPTNGGRQVSSAPDISHVRIVPQPTPVH